MKLVMCVVNCRDKNLVVDALVNAGHKFTVSATVGGFLRAGNATFMVGVEDDQVESVLEIVSQNSKTREQLVNIAPLEGGATGTFLAAPMRVDVGGAVVFVLPVERFERF